MAVARRFLLVRNELTTTSHISALWRRLLPLFSNKERHYSSSLPSPSPLNDSSQAFFDFLKTSLGFRPEEASSLCQKLKNRVSVQKAEGLMDLLKQSGLSDAQAKKVIIRNPNLLRIQPDDTVAPKLKVFRDLGLPVPDITHIIVSNPYILSWSAANKILPMVDVLKSTLSKHHNASIAIKCFFSRSGFTQISVKKLAINLSTLRAHGVPESSLCSLISMCPSAFAVKPNSLLAKMEKIRQLGIDYDSGMFPIALKAVAAVSETLWDAKVEVLKSFGWSHDNMVTAFKKAPLFMAMSAASLQKKLEFFMIELGCSPSEIAESSVALNYSLEKRAIPRFKLTKKLDAMKILKSNPKLSMIIQLIEEQFYEEYVLKHKSKCPDMFLAFSSGKTQYLLSSFLYSFLDCNA